MSLMLAVVRLHLSYTITSLDVCTAGGVHLLHASLDVCTAGGVHLLHASLDVRSAGHVQCYTLALVACIAGDFGSPESVKQRHIFWSLC